VVANAQEKSLILSQSSWTDTAAGQLSANLTPAELEAVRQDVETRPQRSTLWALYDETGRQVASVVTRLDRVYGGKIHFVIIHGGGEWTRHLGFLLTEFKKAAFWFGASVIRLHAEDDRFSRISVDRYGFKKLETITVWGFEDE
jgi:hypothetical protein